MKAKLPQGMKSQLNKELKVYLKLDSEIKALTSKKNEIKLQLNAVLDEFGIDKLALSQGTLTMVKGSTRNSIADWDKGISSRKSKLLFGEYKTFLATETAINPRLRYSL